MAVAGDDHPDGRLRPRVARQAQRLGGGGRGGRCRALGAGVRGWALARLAPPLQQPLVELAVAARHLLQRELGQHPPARAPAQLAAPLVVAEEVDDRLGIGGDVVARLDHGAAVGVHELDVAGQGGDDDRHAHRQRLIHRVGHALVAAGHQHQLGAAVPARHLLGGRVPLDHLGDAELGGAPLRLLHQRPVPDDVEGELGAARAGGGDHLEGQHRVLLLGQPAGPEDPRDRSGRAHRRDRGGIELAGGIDAGGDRLDPAPRDVVSGDHLGQLLAGDREGVDQVGVAPRRVADVAGLVGLLGVHLDDDRGRLRQAGDVGQQVEAQARVHDVDDPHAAAGDEVEDEAWERAARHQVRQVPDLGGEGLDQVQPAVRRRLGRDQRRPPALAVDRLEPVDRPLVGAAEVDPGREVEDWRRPGAHPWQYMAPTTTASAGELSAANAANARRAAPEARPGPAARPPAQRSSRPARSRARRPAPRAC